VALDALGVARAQAAAEQEAALAEARRVVAEQDAEYAAALTQDQAKAAAAAAAAAAAREGSATQSSSQAPDDVTSSSSSSQPAKPTQQQQQQQQRLSPQQLAAGLQQLRDLLQPLQPPEPSPDTPAVTLRVRLPGGSVSTRRFAPDAGWEVVEVWVQGLEGLALPPGEWHLASSYPRLVLRPAVTPATQVAWQQVVGGPAAADPAGDVLAEGAGWAGAPLMVVPDVAAAVRQVAGVEAAGAQLTLFVQQH
jgi:hypothetical protein